MVGKASQSRRPASAFDNLLPFQGIYVDQVLHVHYVFLIVLCDLLPAVLLTIKWKFKRLEACAPEVMAKSRSK